MRDNERRKKERNVVSQSEAEKETSTERERVKEKERGEWLGGS